MLIGSKAGKAVVSFAQGDHSTLNKMIALVATVAVQAHSAAPAAKKLLTAIEEFRKAVDDAAPTNGEAAK